MVAWIETCHMSEKMTDPAVALYLEGVDRNLAVALATLPSSVAPLDRSVDRNFGLPIVTAVEPSRP